MPFGEKDRFNLGTAQADYYRRWLTEARSFLEEDEKLLKVLRAEDQPWENSSQGKLKHLSQQGMGLREHTVDIYIQAIEPGSRSGKHWHAAEEMLFILEGEGHDLHWDPCPEIWDRYEWKWRDEPKKLVWRDACVVYIPPFVVHQHFAGPSLPVRFISATSRVIKKMGFNHIEQIEPAPGYIGG